MIVILSVAIGIAVLMALPTTVQAQGDPSNCLDFDGADDYVEIPGASELDLTTQATIEAWVQVIPTGSYTGIVAKMITTNQQNYLLQVSPTGILQFTYSHASNPNDWIQTTETYGDGSWHHVAGVIDTTVGQVIQLYVDGELKASSPVLNEPMLTTTNPVAIGARLDSGNTYQGKMDEVRVWSIARSQTEIQDNMNLTLSGSETGLVAYYQFDESSGTALPDRAGTNDGTLTNMDPATDWQQSFAMNYPPGNCLDFDGTNDYVEVPYSADLNPAAFTAECWSKSEGGGGTFRPLIRSGESNKGYRLWANATTQASYIGLGYFFNVIESSPHRG